jgi:hypothetical protein
VAKGEYVTHGDAQTVSTAITLLELTAPATAIEIIMRWKLSQSSVTTSTTARARLLRKSVSITGTASPPTPAPRGADAASGATVKWIATVEGTDGVVIDEDGFNYLAGWGPMVPGPLEQVIVPPSGICAIKFPAAVTSASFSFGLGHQELG